MPHDLDATMEATRKGGRRKGQRTARDITNVNTLKALTRPTRVAQNLWLYPRGGSKSWVMEWMKDGKRCWLGLGAWPEVSLPEAKAKVAEAKAKLAKGEDPRKPIVEHRFRDVVPFWTAKQKPTWSSEKYARGVVSEIATWTDDILGDMDMDALDTPDIHAAMMQLTKNDHPFWLDLTPTAMRVRGYIEKVIGYAIAMKWRTKLNCAAWKDNLEHLLPDPSKIHKPEPHPSLHHSEIAGFMRVLRSMEGLQFRCLDAMIQTGLRSGEAIGARRSEINLDTGLWVIPGHRMKKRRAHTVTLSRQAVALFQALPRDGDLVFGDLNDDALRDALDAVMARAGREWRDKDSGKLIVPHGMRASFGTWAGEHGYEDALIDIALAHAVSSDVLRRYQRSDKAELRRTMMQGWSDHLDGG